MFGFGSLGVIRRDGNRESVDSCGHRPIETFEVCLRLWAIWAVLGVLLTRAMYTVWDVYGLHPCWKERLFS